MMCGLWSEQIHTNAFLHLHKKIIKIIHFFRIHSVQSKFTVFQGCIYEWVRRHRLHHKTFKTADDPYYSDKDFMQAQVLSQFRKLSVKQQSLLDQIDMSDIEQDQVVMFQKK